MNEKYLNLAKNEVDKIRILSVMAQCTLESGVFDNPWRFYPFFVLLKSISKKAQKYLDKTGG